MTSLFSLPVANLNMLYSYLVVCVTATRKKKVAHSKLTESDQFNLKTFDMSYRQEIVGTEEKERLLKLVCSKLYVTALKAAAIKA